jgi:hypothetical protein
MTDVTHRMVHANGIREVGRAEADLERDVRR